MTYIDQFEKFILALISQFFEFSASKLLAAAVVSLSICYLLVHDSQAGLLLSADIAAYEAKFKYEEKAEVDNLNNVSCGTAPYPADCKIAKYKMSLLNEHVSAFQSLVSLNELLVILTALLCALSFLGATFRKSAELNKTKQEGTP